LVAGAKIKSPAFAVCILGSSTRSYLGEK
jgi:hypothetical protein